MLQPETLELLKTLKPGTVAHESMIIGRERGEPIFHALDGMLRYAKAHKTRYESELSEDPVLGGFFLEVVKGLRGLLDGDGAVALEMNRSTDSKDNGVCEGIFWCALTQAGFTEEDV